MHDPGLTQLTLFNEPVSLLLVNAPHVPPISVATSPGPTGPPTVPTAVQSDASEQLIPVKKPWDGLASVLNAPHVPPTSVAITGKRVEKSVPTAVQS